MATPGRLLWFLSFSVFTQFFIVCARRWPFRQGPSAVRLICTKAYIQLPVVRTIICVGARVVIHYAITGTSTCTGTPLGHLSWHCMYTYGHPALDLGMPGRWVTEMQVHVQVQSWGSASGCTGTCVGIGVVLDRALGKFSPVWRSFVPAALLVLFVSCFPYVLSMRQPNDRAHAHVCSLVLRMLCHSLSVSWYLCWMCSFPVLPDPVTELFFILPFSELPSCCSPIRFTCDRLAV